MIAWATVAVKNTSALGSGRATMNWLPTIPAKNPTTVFARPPMPMMLRVADHAGPDGDGHRARRGKGILDQPRHRAGYQPGGRPAAQGDVHHRHEDQIDQTAAGSEKPCKRGLQCQRDDDDQRDAERPHERPSS